MSTPNSYLYECPEQNPAVRAQYAHSRMPLQPSGPQIFGLGSWPEQEGSPLCSEHNLFSHNNFASVAHGLGTRSGCTPHLPSSRVFQCHHLREPFFTKLIPQSFLAFLQNLPALVTLRGPTYLVRTTQGCEASSVFVHMCAHAHVIQVCMCAFCLQNLGPCSTYARDGGDTR